jgi:hypothetical protein
LFVQRYARLPLAPRADLRSLAPAQPRSMRSPNRACSARGAAALVAALSDRLEARGALAHAADARPAARGPCHALPPAPIYGRAPDAKLPA